MQAHAHAVAGRVLKLASPTFLEPRTEIKGNTATILLSPHGHHQPSLPKEFNAEAERAVGEYCRRHGLKGTFEHATTEQQYSLFGHCQYRITLAPGTRLRDRARQFLDRLRA